MSRHTLLRGTALGPLSACAGPTGTPGPGTLTLGLNRSLVSPDNKLNQFEAAVTVQRAVRQAPAYIGPALRPQPMLADRFGMTEPTAWTVRLREGVRHSDGRPVTVEDVATAPRMYAEVSGSFLMGLFPEVPEAEPVDGRTPVVGVAGEGVPPRRCWHAPPGTGRSPPRTGAPRACCPQPASNPNYSSYTARLTDPQPAARRGRRPP